MVACPAKMNNCISRINCTTISTVVKLYMCLVLWILDMQLFIFAGQATIFEAEYQCNPNNGGGGRKNILRWSFLNISKETCVKLTITSYFLQYISVPPPKQNEQTCCKDHLSMFFRPPHYQSCNIILLRKCFACPSKMNNCISKINCTAISTVVKLYMCLVQWILDMQLFFFEGQAKHF